MSSYLLAIIGSYTFMFTNFVNTSVTTAPPQKIQDESDVSHTCLYISATDVPLPTVCVKRLKELDDCIKSPHPSVFCYDIIGVDSK